MDNDALLLRDLIERDDFEEALEFLQRNPHSIAPDRFLQLCSGTHADSPEAALGLARLMLRLKPNVLQHARKNGLTALHECVGRHRQTAPDGTLIPRSTALALLLIKAYPEGVNAIVQMPYIDGLTTLLTPFHMACEGNAEFAVLKAMLEVNPRLATQDCGHATIRTPLHCVLPNRERSLPIDDRDILILSTAMKGCVMDPLPTEHLLHAACNYRCPRYYYYKLMFEDDGAQQQLNDTRQPRQYPITLWDTSLIPGSSTR